MPLERSDRECRFITDEMLEEKLVDILDRITSEQILQVPGVKELLIKEFEAAALRELVDEGEFDDDEEDEEEDGPTS